MRRVRPLLVLLAPAACRTMVEVPSPPPPLPIVEGLLVADSGSAVFRLVWSGPPTPLPAEADPIPPAQVALELRGSGGRAALAPIPDSAGYFRAHLSIERGGRYELAGTVAGRALHAVTTAPASFDVALPGDTIVVTRQPGVLVPFRWTARGASAFFLRGARFRLNFGVDGRSTAGDLLLDSPGAPGLTRFEILAITPEADEYLFSPGLAPRSNVEGGFGYLGAGIAVSRVVRWE